MRGTRALVERWHAWSPAILLAGLAALTVWLDAQVQPPEPPRDGSVRHDPDVFITNFRAVSFDEAGREKQALTAQRAQHHPDDGSIEFTSPSLVITEPGEPKLTVTADAGTLSGDRETVIFRGHVEALREASTAGSAGSSTGPLKLTTELLRVLPSKGIAETDKAVTIEDPRGIIQGVGMTLDNRSRTVKLKSGVRGSFQPDSPK